MVKGLKTVNRRKVKTFGNVFSKELKTDSSSKQQPFMTIHTTNITFKRVYNEIMFSNSSIRKSSLSADCTEMVSPSFDVSLVMGYKKISVLLICHYKILSQISQNKCLRIISRHPPRLLSC